MVEASKESMPADEKAPWAQVCAHKLFAPTRYAGAIRRASALERILDLQAPRVTFLQAPAGHGKSTLLQQAKTGCEAMGFHTGWLTFDDADNDMRRCSLHLHALLNSILGGGSEVRPIDVGAEGEGRQRRSDWFISQIVAHAAPVAIFFDEFQTLTSKPILAFFRELLERLPENVRIYIGSRSTPDVGLVRLVVNNQALLLRADDLRFSPTEVAQFFSGLGDLCISSEEVEAIYRQTEGWPAALQLFRLTLTSPSVRQSLANLGDFRPRELAEYLSDNVLSLQSADIQEFLLRTSLLRRLTAPLCDAIMGRSDSQDVLLFLERSGLFVRMLDSGGHWFTYHTLFSSCLAERFGEISRDAVARVHRQAAEWFRRHEVYEEALHHASEVEDFYLAADVLNIWASKLVPNGHLITVERWFNRLPLREIQSRPDLARKIAWTLIFLRRHAAIGSVLAALTDSVGDEPAQDMGDLNVVRSMAAIMNDDMPLAFHLIDRVKVRDQRPAGFWAFELGAAANLTAYRSMVLGDLDAARSSLSLAHVYNDSVDATFSGGYSVGLSGMQLIMQGMLPKALERFKSATSAQLPGLDKSFSSAALTSCHIFALYQADQFDAAEALFAQFQDSIADSALLDFLAVAFTSVARIHESRGRGARVQEVLDEAESIGHANRWPRLVRLVMWERVRSALIAGDVERASSIAAHLKCAGVEAVPDAWLPFSEDVAGELIGEIRLNIHNGNLHRAQEQLAVQVALAISHGRIHRQIKLYVLDAMLRARLGDHAVSRRSLRRALRLAQNGDFIRAFLEEGDPIITLLRAEQRVADLAAGPLFAGSMQFVNRLLGAAGVESREESRRDPLLDDGAPEPLTEREIQILVQLTNGVSNRQMAGKIFVSENTVKYHLKNIYTKLKVSGRVQAINAARDLGLVR